MELLASRIEGIRQSQLYGVRPMWTFREAAQKYLKDNQHKKSVSDDERHLAMLDPFIGDLLLSRVYMETLRPFIEKLSPDTRRRWNRGNAATSSPEAWIGGDCALREAWRPGIRGKCGG